MFMRHRWLWAVAILSAPCLHADDEVRPTKPRLIIGTRIVAEPAPAQKAPAPLPNLDSSLPFPREVVVVSAPAEPSPARLPVTLEGLLRDQPVNTASRAEASPNVTVIREVAPAQTTPTPVVVQPTIETSTDATTTILRHTIAVLVAVVLVLFVLGLAGAIAFRRYAPALFQVQVVGGPTMPFVLPALLEAEKATATSESYTAPEPNFELGPTYEEELKLKEQEAERQSLAILERIADDNLALRQELSALQAPDELMESSEPETTQAESTTTEEAVA